VTELAPAITRSTDHHYRYAGETYPGVTGVLGVLDKSGPLMGWASRETAKAAVAQIANLPSLLETVGEEGVIKALTARSTWQRDEAAQLGTQVHHLADLYVRGEPLPPMSETIKARVEAYADWWKASGWTLRVSEAYIVSPALRYGGTFDLLAKDADGRTVLADIKSGRAVYREAALQLAAYGMAELVARPGDTKAYPMPKVDRYAVLHVTADGVREIELSIGQAEYMAWMACLELSRWAESMKGKPL
jgi:hypothetical protein